MVLLEEGSKIDELLDATPIGLRLQSASQRSEVNHGLIRVSGLTTVSRGLGQRIDW
jgi:hypothetical protein